MSGGQSSNQSPARVGSLHGKSGAIVSAAKSVLSEQHNRLATKHAIDLDVIDDLRVFLKTKSNIEREYSQALIKLATSQAKKYPQFSSENDSEVKTLYTAWKTYLEEVERFAKNRLSQFDQFGSVCDTLKQLRTHKVQIAKKSIDQHLKKMQEEVLTSVNEIDKTRKLYFDEEHLAKQARDKEEKIKKRKVGIFSSLANLQTKKEKTSAHREASDIQSTQARNDYLMALAAGNAHLDHYYAIDLPNLIHSIDDDLLDKCRGFIILLLQSEINSLSASSDAINKSFQLIESSSADFTNSVFLAEPQSACLRESIYYDFDAYDNDSINTISLEHNADIALRNEVQKWFTWFAKECRNLNRLSQQLIKCQTLLADGHKTVEASGSAPVDIEVRIDDIKQQIRKCEISKLKAKARLQVIREGGLEIEDYDNFEAQVTTEIKQTSLDVDISIGMPLSRTPSLRSANIGSFSGEGRISSLDGKISDEQHESDTYQTPEPELMSGKSGRPESSSSDVLESPEREPTQTYQSYDANAGWGDYEASATWDDQPVEEYDNNNNNSEIVNEGQENYENNTYYEEYMPSVDGTQIVGKICRALYSYESQNQDDLSFLANENLTIIEACDKDWVKAQNERYMIGFVPAAYLEVIGDAPHDDLNLSQELPLNSDNTDNNSISVQITAENGSEGLIVVRALYDYVSTSDEELTFNEGDILTIISKSDDGWWLGMTKDGVQGHFSSMLVEEQGDNKCLSAFEESGDESEESIESLSTPLAPPPSFAPPKPAYLTPHQVVIIQPTPEIESKPQLGEEEENSEQEIKVEVRNVDLDDETNNDSNNAVINPDFTLDKPSARKNIEETDSETKSADIVNGTDENHESSKIVINVEEIECTAEVISEAITHDAICDAAKEALAHESFANNQTDNINNNYENGDSDYEDLK